MIFLRIGCKHLDYVIRQEEQFFFQNILEIKNIKESEIIVLQNIVSWPKKEKKYLTRIERRTYIFTIIKRMRQIFIIQQEMTGTKSARSV